MKKQMVAVWALAMLLICGGSAVAQKGLYLGGGLGYCALGGDIKDDYDPGLGYHAMIGFKATQKIGIEVEFGAYEQKPKSKEAKAMVEDAAFGGFQANLKYFLGPRHERPFRPYVVAGLGLNAFAWSLKDVPVAKNEDDEDGIAALSFVPGLGFELMVGRIAALNFSGRYAINSWGDETAEGHKVEDMSGNALLLNLGLILHL